MVRRGKCLMLNEFKMYLFEILSQYQGTLCITMFDCLSVRSNFLQIMLKVRNQSVLPLAPALSWKTKLFALVPAPFWHLIGGHADLASDHDLRGVGPVRVILKVVVQDLLLVRSLHHALTFLVILHVIALQHQSHSMGLITDRSSLLGWGDLGFVGFPEQGLLSLLLQLLLGQVENTLVMLKGLDKLDSGLEVDFWSPAILCVMLSIVLCHELLNESWLVLRALRSAALPTGLRFWDSWTMFSWRF